MRRGKPLQRRTPLKAKVGLKAKKGLDRKTPIRPRSRKASTPKPELEKKHMGRVAQKGCCVCGRPATVHHVTGYADRQGRFDRSDRLVVPLCPKHHQAGHDPKASDPVSVERLSHRGFYDKHGIDLLALAQRLWKETECELG